MNIKKQLSRNADYQHSQFRARFCEPWICYGGGKSQSAPPPPDYRPMAAASDHAADIGKELGEAQLTEAKRQYENNMAVSKPVVDQQLGLMKQQQVQGDDYFDYMQKTFRPLEQGMVKQAADESSVARQEEEANRAAADQRVGQTQQTNALVQQGLRYGWSPEKVAAAVAAQGGANASAVAGAMTNARSNQRNIGWARSMDAAGLGRNLPGASQGAYGLSINSGNAAVANAQQPGNSLMTGMAQGAGMQQAGQAQRVQGYGQVLGAQSSYANSLMNFQSNQQQQNAAGLAGLGQMAGTIGAAYLTGGTSLAAGRSDRRLKENIVRVGKTVFGLPLYVFNYIGDKTRNFRGVMADDVRKVMPAAVVTGRFGYDAVRYDLLGIKLERV